MHAHTRTQSSSEFLKLLYIRYPHPQTVDVFCAQEHARFWKCSKKNISRLKRLRLASKKVRAEDIALLKRLVRGSLSDRVIFEQSPK